MSTTTDYEALCSEVTDEEIAKHLARMLRAWRIHLDDRARTAVDVACALLQDGRGADTFVDLAMPSDAEVGEAYKQLQSIECADAVSEYVIAAACCALEWPQSRKVSPVVWPVADNLRQAMCAWLELQIDKPASPWSTEVMDWRTALHGMLNVEDLMKNDLRYWKSN